MAKQGQNLNLTNIKKEVKKLAVQKEESVFINGNEYKFKIDEKFLKSKQYKLIDDLVEFLNEVNIKPDYSDLITPYTTLLIIKHFTSIEVSNDIDEAIDTLQSLIDLEIISEIVELMPEDEVVKIYELLSETIARMKENMETTSKELEGIEDLVENEEIRKTLN